MSNARILDTPTVPPVSVDKEHIKDRTKEMAREIGELQRIMYAQEKHSLLVVMQGMDAAGKDGATRKVFRYCSHAGLNSISFKKPTELEFAHDFLWRIHPHVPAKGYIQVFNRSHYEDVLIQRVHRWIDQDQVDARIAAINAFEENLQGDNNTTVLKFFLHISRDRQLEKLQERIDNPAKNWKHNAGDWHERQHWDEYMHCYQDVLDRSTVPWHIVPVDARWYRDYSIAKVVLETLKKMDLALPTLEITTNGN